MSLQKRFPLLLLAMVSLILVVSACSDPGSAHAAEPSSLSVSQVLQKSANTMKQVKSAHVNLLTTIKVHSKALPGDINLTLKGNGDQRMPGQEQMNLTMNNGVSVSSVLQGSKAYMKSAQGQWYAVDKNALKSIINHPLSSVDVNGKSLRGMVQNVEIADNGQSRNRQSVRSVTTAFGTSILKRVASGSPLSGITLNKETLLGMLQYIKIIDNGTQSLNGQNLRHITAQLDKNALRKLLASNPQLSNALNAGNLSTVLNNIKSMSSSLDLWIDEANFYIHRTELKINANANITAVGQKKPSAMNIAFDTIVDLSKLNGTITIVPPTHATPTNNPAVALGKMNLQ